MATVKRHTACSSSTGHRASLSELCLLHPLWVTWDHVRVREDQHTFHMSCHSESSVSSGYCYFIWTQSNAIAAHPQYGKGPAWIECGEGRMTKRSGAGVKRVGQRLCRLTLVMTRRLHPLLQLIKLIPSATANTEPFRVRRIFISSDENKPPKLI